MKKQPTCLSRRDFLANTLVAGSALALDPAGVLSAPAPATHSSPIVVFSKIYQSLNLNFDEAAALTAEAGLAGIDCPVRPGGEVLPERVTEDLPRYAEALRKRNLRIHLVTSGITSTSSAHAEAVLREVKKLGVRYYRLGFIDFKSDVPAASQIDAIKGQLKDLAALNATLGLTGMLQNHSPGGHAYIGGDLGQMHQIVKDFDPDQIGVAFDIGHAIVVHGNDWRPYFEKLKSHLKVAYVKDTKLKGGWVPFGEGELGRSGYFNLLKQLGYSAPFSLHIEFKWDAKEKTRAALVEALKQSSTVLKSWVK